MARGVRDRRNRGLTLIELMLAVVVVGILASIAGLAYGSAKEKARESRAMADIGELDLLIQRYRSQHFEYPESLAEVDPTGRMDPWDRPYHYTLLAGTKGKGEARKDRRLNPLNTDYDLFSAGRNGVFKTQISHKDSLDDILRARMGGYIGKAEDI